MHIQLDQSKENTERYPNHSSIKDSKAAATKKKKREVKNKEKKESK